MKTRIYLSIIGLMAFSFLFVSCSKDDEGDTVKPVINLLEPEEGAVLKIGDANGVHFEMDIADNEAIAPIRLIFIIILTAIRIPELQKEEQPNLLLLREHIRIRQAKNRRVYITMTLRYRQMPLREIII